MNETEFYIKLLALPNGANNVMYLNKRYLIIKETLLEGKLLKVYAERLDEIDVISGNYYPTLKNGMLKPCEMSDAKVINFILNATLI
jgi:hypothetical protein